MAIDMTLRGPYTLLNSEFNTFLYAPIGEEGNGMMLSVVSALARLEIEPWEEAARLAAMPKDAAASTLNRLIDRLPRGLWARSDIPVIAASLIELLPHGARVIAPDRQKEAGRGRVSVSALAWLLVLTMALTATVFLGVDNKRTPGGDSGATSFRSSTTSPPSAR